MNGCALLFSSACQVHIHTHRTDLHTHTHAPYYIPITVTDCQYCVQDLSLECREAALMSLQTSHFETFRALFHVSCMAVWHEILLWMI
ncbi:hypothetical protein EON63_02180 [archaeon]|nr:MAG: hypothetical protein EON63_02180 [archaeon]